MLFAKFKFEERWIYICILIFTSRVIKIYISTGIYISEVSNGSTRVMCQVYSKLTLKHQNYAMET